MSAQAVRHGLLFAGALLACHALAGNASAQDDTHAGDGAESKAVPEHGIAAQLGAGAGVGLRDVALPTSEGERRISTGLFPALDVALRADAELTGHALLGARFRYQTSIGMVGAETPYGGVPRETSLRSHHLELGAVPALRFTRSPRSVALGAFLGWSLRAVRSVVDLTLPDYTLHGPCARLELRAPLGTEAVVLRLSPELIAWLWASEDLRAAGALEHAGLALGGEASLHVQAGALLGIELSYRGSRGAIASRLGGELTDTEHYVTAQLTLAY
jgi:hypothetical protein